MARVEPRDEELVSVPVPRSLLPEVSALLHRFYNSDLVDEAELSSASQSDGVVVPRNGTWTKEDIDELFAMFRNKQGRLVITQIAERSLKDQVASYGELMHVSGLNEFELRSQFSWFAKKAKALKGSHVWPVLKTDAGSDAEKGERYHYRLPKPIAEWWLLAQQH